MFGLQLVDSDSLTVHGIEIQTSAPKTHATCCD